MGNTHEEISQAGILGQPYSPMVSSNTYEITIGDSVTEGSVSITSVVKGRSTIQYLGTRTDDGDLRYDHDVPRVELTNGTTAKAFINTADTGRTLTIVVQVTEWAYWAVEKVIHGTISMATSSLSDGVVADSSTTGRYPPTGVVNRNGCVVMFLGATSDNDGQNIGQNSPMVASGFSGGSGVTNFRAEAFRLVGTSNLVVGYCGIVFNRGIIKSIQDVSPFKTDGNDTQEAIAAVVEANTILLWRGFRSGGDFQKSLPYIYLNTTIEVEGIRNTASAVDWEPAASVVEFYPAYIQSQGSGQTTIATMDDIEDVTVTAVDLDKTVMSFLGFSTSNTFSDMSISYPTVDFFNNTTVRCERDSAAGAPTSTLSWNYLEFK